MAAHLIDKSKNEKQPQRGAVQIGIIGGSGLYHLDSLLKFEREEYPLTPWGYPSDKIHIFSIEDGTQVAFLARHGKGHVLNPSQVPSRANIAALKHLGVEMILAFSAVGSLREEIRPLDFVIPSQLVDRTKGIRPFTFFEDGIVAHIQFADPFNTELSKLILKHRSQISAKIHSDKTLVVMEGPAFSTRAESNMYRAWGCDIINMSTLPESKLAREAEIAYQVVCLATDYDCWRPGHEDVSVEAVVATLRENSENAKKLLISLLPDLKTGLKQCRIKGMNKFAIITAKHAQDPKQAEKLAYLFPEYFNDDI